MMKLAVLATVIAVAFGASVPLTTSEQLRTAKVLSQTSEVEPERYEYNYETENGISAQETGSLKTVPNASEPSIDVQGSYQYTDPEGQVFSLSYIANENGFQPQSDVLPVGPTPPPVPPAIARALEYIAAHPTPTP